MLVVEDNAIIRKIAVMNLEKLGVHADIAENGQQAVQKFRAAKYDLVLMDVAMPVLNGLHATEQIRAVEAGR